jgi:hypothetical protein
VEVASAPILKYYGAYREATRATLVWVLVASFRNPVNFDPDLREMWIDAIDGTGLGGFYPHSDVTVRALEENHPGVRTRVSRVSRSSSEPTDFNHEDLSGFQLNARQLQRLTPTSEARAASALRRRS